MKARMRTRYTFHHATQGHMIGWGDCPTWARRVREAWGEAATETREAVMFVTTRPQGAMRPTTTA